MYYYCYNNELYHHGVKGQKWGVRRYQNEDGTYTDLGKKRLTGAEYNKQAVDNYRKISDGYRSGQVKKKEYRKATKEMEKLVRNRSRMTDSEYDEYVNDISSGNKKSRVERNAKIRERGTLDEVYDRAELKAAASETVKKMLGVSMDSVYDASIDGGYRAVQKYLESERLSTIDKHFKGYA